MKRRRCSSARSTRRTFHCSKRFSPKDPHNLDAALRLATAYSSLGRDEQAVAAFQRAEAIAPDSQDVRTYLALHYARGKDWQKAVPLLERVVAESPDRLPALEALAVVRERQGRIADAVALRQKINTMRAPAPAELLHSSARWRWTPGRRRSRSTRSRKSARVRAPRSGTISSWAFCISPPAGSRKRATRSIACRRRIPTIAMALFKRAQVSVLLHEPDAQARIDAARQRATPVTRELIGEERLFREAAAPRTALPALIRTGCARRSGNAAERRTRLRRGP